MTPLKFATRKNDLYMVKVLLDAKAEVNVQSEVSESDGVYLRKMFLIYDNGS
jgi:hypothetical protein